MRALEAVEILSRVSDGIFATDKEVEAFWFARGFLKSNAEDLDAELDGEEDSERCPHCDTVADEYGYCVDVGCSYLGKAVIG